ncbi:Lipase (class 3) [Spirochaeta africana DSM 8902]|uniref:Lipase (Class 3) n=2 Tax=Spirochaeta TaxID=146 RepID=H9UIQ2_SPIAZ|nr:Lipase (class 3) [Spirochaeta africana DSM 8902]
MESLLLQVFDPPLPWKRFSGTLGVDLALGLLDSRTLYINFKCADSLQDMIVNLRMSPQRIPGRSECIRVHRGMLRAYLEVQPDIHAMVYTQGLQRVVIQGFSLGAGLALLCGEDLARLREQDPRLAQLELTEHGLSCVAGAPRVLYRGGDSELFSRRTRGMLRVVNHNDTVTRLPHAWMGYRHTGELVAIGTRRLWPFSLRSFLEHAPQSYLGHVRTPDYRDTRNSNPFYRDSLIYTLGVHAGLMYIVRSLLRLGVS